MFCTSSVWAGCGTNVTRETRPPAECADEFRGGLWRVAANLAAAAQAMDPAMRAYSNRR